MCINVYYLVELLWKQVGAETWSPTLSLDVMFQIVPAQSMMELLLLSRKQPLTKVRLIKTHLIYWTVECYLDNCSNSGANTCTKPQPYGRGAFIRSKLLFVSLNNFGLITLCIVNCSTSYTKRDQCGDSNSWCCLD